MVMANQEGLREWQADTLTLPREIVSLDVLWLVTLRLLVTPVTATN